VKRNSGGNTFERGAVSRFLENFLDMMARRIRSHVLIDSRMISNDGTVVRTSSAIEPLVQPSVYNPANPFKSRNENICNVLSEV